MSELKIPEEDYHDMVSKLNLTILLCDQALLTHSVSKASSPVKNYINEAVELLYKAKCLIER